VNLFTKVRRWLRPPADPEADAEQQRLRAERETVGDRQRSLGGPRGIEGLAPPERDTTDPRR
jgi:hypothetical protein